MRRVRWVLPMLLVSLPILGVAEPRAGEGVADVVEGGESPPARYALFSLSGGIGERDREYVFEEPRWNLRRWVRQLHRAAEDPDLDGVVLDIQGPLFAGWAQVASLREGIARVRASGKRVEAYLTNPDTLAYLVGCAADRTAIGPSDLLMLNGLHLELVYYKGLLDKLGVGVEAVRSGRYKSAVEPFTQDAPSEATLEQMNALLDDLYRQLVESIAASRGMEPDAVRATIDEGPFPSETALAAGLVDAVVYPDAYRDALAARAGGACELVDDYGGAGGPGELETFAEVMEYFAGMFGRRPDSTEERHVALVVAEGPVVDSADAGLFGSAAAIPSDVYVPLLESLAANDAVVAVVLRIDSPGGSGMASDRIWRAVERLRARKPVVASFGNVAASGGYYIAMGCNRIVAQPGTITGSIGVFGMAVDYAALYEKIGLTTAVLSRGAHADFFSGDAPMREEEREFYRGFIDEFYDTFITKAAAGRGMEREAVHAVAQGRVWTGAQALERGLVDVLGGIETAIGTAKREAGFDEEHPLPVVVYPQPMTFGEYLDRNRLVSTAAPDFAGLLPAGLREDLRSARTVLAWGRTPGAVAALPVGIRIR